MKRKPLLFLLLFALLAPWAANAQNQLNEGFESTTFPPQDWGTIHVSGSNYWQRYTTYKHSGDASAYAHWASAGHENYLITPKLEPATGDTLSFFVSAQSYSGTTLYVKVSTTTADASAFSTTLATYTTGSSGTIGTTNPSTWREKTIDLSSYVGQKIFIAFHVVDNNGGDVIIDDVTGVTLYVPACPLPTLSNTVATTSSTATITWTPSGASQTSFDIYWSTTNTAPNENTTPLASDQTGTSYQITNLDASTTYYVWLRGNCGNDGYSDWTSAVSFTTSCVEITTFPWTEDFTGLTSGIPNCWDNSEGTTTYASYKWSYYNAGHDAAPCLRFNSYNNSSGLTNFLKTPVLNFPTGAVMRLVFWYKNPTGGDFSVFISTNGGSTYTTALATALTGQSDWAKKEIDLTDYVGSQNVVIVFKGTSNYGNGDAYIYLDDVTVKEAPSCLAPTALDATNITVNSAELSWTANSSETSWNLYYKKSTATVYTEVPNVTNPYLLDSLDTSTVYEYYVVANCSATETSEPSDTYSFATACPEYVTVPFTETFDSYAGGTGSSNSLPLCWDYINTTSYSYYVGYPTIYNSSSYSHSGNNHLRFYSYYYPSTSTNYDPQPQYAILPGVENPSNMRVKLYARANSTSNNYDATFMVGVMEGNNFVGIDTIKPTTTTYQMYTIPLDRYTGTGTHIAIMIEAADATATSSNYHSVFIDDVTVEPLPDCPTPTGLMLVTNSETPEGATIKWNNVEGASWIVEYKKAVDTEWTAISPAVTDTIYTFMGLEPSTGYQARVSVVCTGVTYPTDPVIFNTKVTCPAPTNFTVRDLTDSSVTLAWKPGYNEEAWTVIYKKSTESTWPTEGTTVSDTTIMLSNLDGNTTYNVRISGCDETHYLSGNFTTKNPCAAPTALVVSNITNNSATLSWTPGYQETEWTVLYWQEEATDTLRRVVNDSPTIRLTDLRAFTTYNVRVINCENALAGSFVTATVVPLIEAFANSSAPKGWNRYTGLLEYVLSDSIQLSSTTSGWYFGTYNGVFDNHARLNIYSTTCKYWMVTPTVLMENNVQLSFDLALTKYSGTLQPVVDSLQQDDKFVVLISTNGRSNWTVLRQWDNAGSEYVYNDIPCSATGRHVTIDLSSYAGQYVAIAFYGESTNPSNMQNTGGDNNLHVDNVSIDYIPSCEKPTGLTVSNVKNHKATLSWTENGEAEAWQICLNGDEDNPIPALENPYTLTGLEADSSYTVKVRANCGGNNGVSDWSNSVSFHTQIACPAPTGLSCTGVTVNTATLSWVENGDAEAWEICLNNDTTNLIPVRENPCTLTDLTPETVYSAKVRSECRSAWSSSITFEPTEKNVIGSGTGTNNYLPLNNFYKYSLTQQIYTAAELGDAGYITSIDFYKNNTIQCVRDVDIYMVSTTKTSFVSTSDWITVTAADRVFSGEVTFANNAWTSIDFDVPFNYDGQSNVAIIVDDNTGDYKSTTSFLAYDATGQAIRAYYDTYDFDPFNPSGAANTYVGVENQKNQIRILKANCLKPNHITVEEFANSVNIDWEGESDSYNVRYRTAETLVPSEGSFSDDFESGELTGWTAIRGGEGVSYTDWQVVNGETLFEDPIPAHSGTYFAMSRSWYSWDDDAPNVDNWLISPQVTLDGELSYWVMDDGQYHEHYDVYVSTTDTELTSFSLLYEPGDASDEWTQHTVDLSSFNGASGYIAFRHTDNDQDFLFIDDVLIGSVETAPAGEWVELPVSETFIEIDSLASNTQYEYQIQGVCGEDPSHWTTIADFTTLAEGTMVFVTEGDWNVANNWVPANLPTEDNNVVIRKDATIPAGVIAYANEATLDGGSITIKDGGQLVHNTDGLWATVEKEITGYGNSDYGYNFIATPLKYSDSYYADYLVTFTEDVENLIPEDEESYDLYEFDPTQEGAEWRNDKTSSVYMFTGDGYLYANPVNDTLKFEGALWKTKDNSLGMAVADTLTTTSNGWRLIGNPFVTIGYIVGVDDEFNIIENNFYTMNAAGDGYDLSESAVGLYPCEGAFVQDAADADSQTIYFFSYNPFAGGDKSGILNMNLLQEGNKIDQARLRFGKGNELGKMTFRKDQSKLSITKDGEEFAVVYVGNKGEMPVSFKAEKEGTYTIDFSTDNVNFSYLHLIDTVTNTEVDLIANPSYTFEAKAGEFARRFTIVYETK